MNPVNKHSAREILDEGAVYRITKLRNGLFFFSRTFTVSGKIGHIGYHDSISHSWRDEANFLWQMKTYFQTFF